MYTLTDIGLFLLAVGLFFLIALLPFIWPFKRRSEKKCIHMTGVTKEAEEALKEKRCD